MLSLWKSCFLGLVQGATELFPVSSLGHAVVLPRLLRLDYDQSNSTFVPFLVLLHLGTAAALLLIYRREWARLIAGFVRAAARGEIRGDDERMAMLIVVGTIPAGVIGFFGDKPLKSLFAKPAVAAAFLIANGGILLGAELLRRRDERRRHAAEDDPRLREAAFARAESLSFPAAALVGLCQALALLPGISRSGVTMAGGLLAGLSHEQAVRFSFLLATPIIAAAGVLEVPELFNSGVPVGTYLAGAAVAAVAAYASARFLVRYFRVGRLDPFAAYCAAFGVVGLVFAR